MLETPQIVQTPAIQAAMIRLTIPRSEIRTVMGPGIKEVMAALKDQGIAPAGAWFTHHLKMDPAVFDFAICVPVSRPVAPVGRVVSGEIPASKVARTVYQGPYEGLGDAWGEFQKWIAAQGHTMAPSLWEVYAEGPETHTDSSKFRTELNKPLLG